MEHPLQGQLEPHLLQAVSDPRLHTDLAGLHLRNPVVLASGFLGETGPSLVRAFSNGCGAVVTKSIGSAPRVGHRNPTLVEVDGGLLNAIGLANPGIDHFRSELQVVWDAKVPGPVIGSVFGGSAEELVALGKAMARHGVQALELNLSCPHVKGVGTEVGSDPAMVQEICTAVTAAVPIPVFAKLSPNIDDIARIATAAADGGVAGLTAINTLRGMAIDVELRRPVLASGQGGLSGPAIRPVGVAATYRIASALDLPIMGVGGIESGAHALEYLMAGASAVQVGTVLMERGMGAFALICHELQEFVEANRLGSLSEIVGTALGDDRRG